MTEPKSNSLGWMIFLGLLATTACCSGFVAGAAVYIIQRIL